MKASMEWCPLGTSCRARQPWQSATRTMGLSMGLTDEQIAKSGRSAQELAMEELGEMLGMSSYTTDRNGVRRVPPPTAHFVVHESYRDPHTGERRFAAHYAGHVPPDELIEAQPEYEEEEEVT